MRSVFISLVCVFSFALAGCGDDSSGIVGTWVPDTDAMKADIDKHLKPAMDAGMGMGLNMGEAALKGIPDGPQKDMLIKKLNDAKAQAAERQKDPFGNMTVEVKGDGTYVRSAGGKVEERGNWKLDGTKLTITPAEGEDGQKVESPTAQSGTYEGGRIKFKPEGAPMTFVLKKQ